MGHTTIAGVYRQGFVLDDERLKNPNLGSAEWYTEQVTLLEEGGIETFIRREVLPYTSDA